MSNDGFVSDDGFVPDEGDGFVADETPVPAAPAPLSVAPSVTGFTADDVTASVKDAERTARHTRLRLAFDESRKTNEDDAATTVAVAGQLGVPFDTVRQNLPAFKETAAAVQWDPERWEKENPQLAKLVLENPHLGSLVMRSKEAGPIVKALRAASDWVQDFTRVDQSAAPNEGYGVTAATPEEFAAKQAEQQAVEVATQESNQQAIPAERAKRDAPRQVQERNDFIAQYAQQKTGIGYVNMVLWQRGIEAKKGLDLSRKQFDLMLAENGIRGDANDLRAEIHDLKLEATPRAFGDDSGLMRDLSEGIQGVASTVDVGVDSLKGLGVGGTAGFVLGAGVTAFATRSPGLSLEAGIEGAKVLGGKGATAAAFLSATQLETGTSYEVLRNEKTDAGQKLTPGEAMGGAVIQGLMKGALEVVSLGQQAKVLKEALPSGVTGLLKRDPTFRALLSKVAKEYAKSVATESITEGLQDAVEQVGSYVELSAKDGALQTGPVYDVERGAQAVQGGFLGALMSGGVTSSMALVTTRTGTAKAEVSSRAVAPLLELAQQPAVKAAPKEFAQLVADTTAEGGGAPITALHVDAHAIVKYFQKDGVSAEAANAQVAELLGPDAPAQLLDAAASGGKLEVPVEAVLSKWGTSDIGKALVDDTTTSSAAMTPRQLKEQSAEIEAETQRIVAEETAKMDEASALAEQTQALEQQLVEAGQGKAQAKAGAALVRAFMATQASDFGKAVSQVFPETPLAFAKGDETAAQAGRVNQEPADSLKTRATAVDVQTRASELFIDPVSGLRNRRAWDESPRKPGTQVAVITSPDIKALNDHPTGGHDTANELLRLIGGVVGGVDAEAARSGTNFLLHAKNREELRAAVNKVRAALPLGLTVEGALAGDIDAAFAKLDAKTEAKRKAGELPARGATSFNLSTLGRDTFAVGKPAQPNVGDQLIARAKATTGEAFAREAYFDRDVEGVLSKTGFDALGERAWVSAFDLKGLKRINDTFGKISGNAILQAFGEAAVRAAGGDVAFAHLSGDEYAAKHDDKAKLAEFEARLRIELQKIGVSVRFGGAQFELTPDFRSGIGEKTYGAADRDLNTRKRAEAAANDVQPVRGPDGATARDEGGVAQRDGGRQGDLAGQEVTRLKQDTGSAPKGYTELPAGRALQRTIRAFLNKSADVSTVIHESAHAFLEQLFDLAERPDAPQRTKDTVAAALKAFGVEDRKDVTETHHEQFARAFENYVMEGKAPSAALGKAFAKFTRWLTGIYRTLAGIPGTELSVELKPVFDAMLATERQLEALRRAQGPKLSAEQLAVSKAERQQQLEEEADEYTEGSHAAQLRAVKDALRVREAWWKKGLKQLEANFADEYEQLPARKAQVLLIENEVVLDRALVQEVIGDARFPGLRTTETGGTRPSTIAELAGYTSPRAMLAELAGLRSKETWVAAQANATMRQLHPGILDDMKGFKALLSDGLRSATEKRLEREVKGLPREALKRAAAALVQKREVGKLQPGKALALQRQAANAKARAMAKGDINATREAARAELLNHFLHGELVKAEKEVEKVEGLAKRLGKAAARERLGKASPAYRDAVDFLRGALGFGEPTELTDATLEAAVGQLEGDAVTIGDPDWLAPVRAALARVDDYQKLTLAELGEVHDALSMLETGARNRTTVLLDGKRIDFDEAKATILEEFASTVKEGGPLVAKHAKSLTERLAAGLNAIDGMLISPIDMFRELTGDNQASMTWKLFVNTMRRAQSLEADLLKQVVEPISKAFEAMPKELQRSANDLVDFRALFPQHDEAFLPRRRYELWMMALNAGNESNLSVLTEGRGITEQQVRTALNLLTKEEITLVNAIHASVESLREPAFALEERETGLRPKAVAARPVTLANGELHGGYFPLKAEPNAGPVGMMQAGEEALASLFDPTFTRPGTTHGHLKARSPNAKYVVSLDPANLRKHLHQVIHDISFREAVKNAGRMILDKDVVAELQRRQGEGKAREPLLWLKDIGGARGLETNELDRLVGWAKGNMATALLSGLSTAVGNLANLPAAVTGTKLKSRHLAAATAELARAPRQTTAFAREKSGLLRAADNELVAGFEKEFASLRSGPLRRGVEWTKSAGMAAMRTIDGTVSTAVWLGAYRQALANGLEEGAAVRWADDIFTQVQPSSSVVEKARVLREKGWVGGLTMFYGYLSVAYRTQHRIASPLFTQAFQEASAAKKALMAGAVAGNLFGFYVAFQALGNLGMGRGPEDGDRDEEEPDNELLKWRNWLARQVFVAPLSTLPVVPFSQIVEGLLLHKKVNQRADPLTGAMLQLAETGGMVLDAIQGNEVDDAKVTKSAVRSLGLTTGLPVRFGDVTGGYLWDITAGERPVPNAGRFVGGLIYGEKDTQPDNLPVLIGDGLTSE